jgi:hypothetical protein
MTVVAAIPGLIQSLQFDWDSDAVSDERSINQRNPKSSVIRRYQLSAIICCPWGPE